MKMTSMRLLILGMCLVCASSCAGLSKDAAKDEMSLEFLQTNAVAPFDCFCVAPEEFKILMKEAGRE